MRNIAESTRGIEEGKVVNGVVWYRSTNLSYKVVAGKNFQTLIVYGNLTIDTDIPTTRGIIVLKDTEGK